jgi:multidrug resistance protein, MATE family
VVKVSKRIQYGILAFGFSSAAGRQHLGALFNLVAYYVLALPLGITLAFRYNQGLEGLWIGELGDRSIYCVRSFSRVGQVIALFIVGIGEYSVVWLYTDWDLEVQRGIERNLEEAKRQGHSIIAVEAEHGDPSNGGAAG